MPIRIGTVNLKKRFIGASEVLVSYIGTTLVYKSITKYVSDFVARVTADSGVTELTANVTTKMQDLRNKDLFESASMVFIPSGYKASKLYGNLSALSDFTFARNSTKTRLNQSGIIESIAVNVPSIENGALLLEPQRTNLCTHSNNFGDASWVKSASVNVVSNIPDVSNGSTASRITITTQYHHISQYNLSTTNGAICTVSVWIKKVSGSDKIGLRAGTNGGTYYAEINITTEWKRYSVSFTHNGVDHLGFSLQKVTPNSTDVVDVCFAQFEQGSYPTSYIPTTTTTVTRNADLFTRNNVFTNGMITAQGGTWFVELKNNIILTRSADSNGIFLDTNTTTLTNGFNIKNNGTNARLSINKTVANTTTALYTTTTDLVKLAIKWNGTTSDIFQNGVKVVTATSFTPINMEFLNSLNADVNKSISQMALYTKPLTDAECVTLTTL